MAGPHNSRGLFEGSALVWRLGLAGMAAVRVRVGVRAW